MNWDTNEAWQWITSEEEYYVLLKVWIGNELLFIDALVDIIADINKKVGEKIEFANVNGNEIYVDFCELNGNEVEGWK